VPVLRLFAAARVAAGTGRDEVDGATVADVLASARDRYGEPFAAVLRTAKVWVNGEPADGDVVVGEGDEVAVLPPVSGGCGDGVVAPAPARLVPTAARESGHDIALAVPPTPGGSG